MRFDHLFDDLESQLESELGASERSVADEEERFRIGKLELRERIREAGPSIDFVLRGGQRLRAKRVSVGRDWFSGEVLDGGQEGAGCVVPFRSIASIRMDEAAAVSSIAPSPEKVRLADRLSLGFVLRDFARRRIWLRVHGQAASHLAPGGTIDRVGRDHFDLAVHEQGTIRARGNVSHVAIVPFSAIEWVQVDP